MNPSEVSRISIKRFRNDDIAEVEDTIAIEEPLEISITFRKGFLRTQKNISITMRTPGNDGELATGFQFTEGVLHPGSGIEKTEQIDPNRINIHLQEGSEPDLSRMERSFYTSSSCGVCGKSSIDSIHTVRHYTMGGDFTVKRNVILGLNESVMRQQAIFERTGGLHASALFDSGGRFLALYEDVGRHNALDKLLGNAFLDNKLPLQNHILFLSGRVSFELIQKAAMAGIPFVCGLGAPSSLAVELAVESGMTVVGFLKERSFNVYCGGQRLS